MSTPFKFKQFTIEQDRCAMKVGTDAVLLGAWVSLESTPQRILDIGAGTGVISMQMAQRSSAETIDAVEIDEDAYEQCVENFENSDWADRLFCYHASAQEFAASFMEDEEEEERYDLIVSNPPFYLPSLRQGSSLPEGEKIMPKSRKLARFTDALPFEHLIGCVHALLSKSGSFSLILPRKEEEHFIVLASEAGLFPKRICRVRGTKVSEEKRSMITFTFSRKETLIENLTLEIERHNYTEAYKKLVADFYLKM